MTAADLPWLALVAGVALLAYACRLLAADAKGGFEVSMGGAMFFSGVWMFGSAALAWSGTALLALPWWAGLIAFVALMLLKSLIYRVIVALYLGSAMPPPQSGGFGEFVKRTEKKPDQDNG